MFYGPESVVLAAALGQAKRLRNIMKAQAAFYSRVSNKTLLEDASTMLYGEPRKLRPFSKVVSDRAITLLGHVIRANDGDPKKIIAIDAEYKRVERLKRRVGTPRFFWLQATMARAHKLRCRFAKETRVDFDIRNKQQREYVANAALSREYPFAKKTKR